MSTKSLGEFLFSYLRDRGVQYCFGIPGDYILPLYKALESTPGIGHVVATHEPCAAFSADAYGRQRGLGALLVTYGVGGFNALNGVAGAYAESSPLLVVSGGPPTGSGGGGDLFSPIRHHVVKGESDQLDVFAHVTDLALRIGSVDSAADTIRRAVAQAIGRQSPVYLEVPTDLMAARIPVPPESGSAPTRDRAALERAAAMFRERISAAERPVLLLGVEVGRFRLQRAVRAIMESRGMPAATTVLGKGVFDETEEGMLGVYAGVLCPDPAVRSLIEESDLVVMLGTKITDVNCGAFTADLKRESLLVAKSDWIGDGYMRFADRIPFPDFVRLLAEKPERRIPRPSWPSLPRFDYSAGPSEMDRFVGVIDKHLGPEHVVVADTGDSCYSSLFITVKRGSGYIAPTFYNTMGFAVPAALGAALADRSSRPVVLVGDGAFQMTGLEMSNMVRLGLDPIVILFNNSGFGMQRVFVDGLFNDLAQWDFRRVTELVGGGRYWRATDPRELDAALGEAESYREGPSLIEVTVKKGDISTGLRNLTAAITREKTGLCPASAGRECEHSAGCAFCRAAIWK